jgi:hypothetical protein
MIRIIKSIVLAISIFLFVTVISGFVLNIILFDKLPPWITALVYVEANSKLMERDADELELVDLNGDGIPEILKRKDGGITGGYRFGPNGYWTDFEITGRETKPGGAEGLNTASEILKNAKEATRKDKLKWIAKYIIDTL